MQNEALPAYLAIVDHLPGQRDIVSPGDDVLLLWLEASSQIVTVSGGVAAYGLALLCGSPLQFVGAWEKSDADDAGSLLGFSLKAVGACMFH